MMSKETRIASEREYDFTLVLKGVAELTTDLEDKVFEAGCDDATIGMRSGRVFLTFARSAASMKDAIVGAICDVKKAGFNVARVAGYELTTQSEIARKTQRSRQQVHQWTTGERGPGGFPPPVCQITDGHPLWRWCDVASWLYQNNMVKHEVLVEAEEAEAVNIVLAYFGRSRSEPDLFQGIVSRIYGEQCPNQSASEHVTA